MRKLTFFLLLAMLFACGKKGPARPPVPVIPQAVTDLSVTQRGPRVLLTWSYPSLTTSGESLKQISRIVIYRYRELLPVTIAAEQRPADSQQDVGTVPVEIRLFSKVSPLTPLQFEKLRETLEAVGSKELPGLTVGSRIVYDGDEPEMRSEDGRPVRLTYAVVTETEDQKSALSNLVTIVPLEISAPPSALRAIVLPEAVVLQWTAPDKTAGGGSNLSILGYNIYRRTSEGLGAAVNPDPVKETSYRDVPSFGAHEYLVTTVTSVGPPVIESEPSAPAQVEYRDFLPPPAPPTVDALTEDRAVRLVWDAVEASDFAGFRVYRRRVGGDRQLLSKELLTDTNYRDGAPETGVRFVYEVTSLDTSGNESKPAVSREVLVTK